MSRYKHLLPSSYVANSKFTDDCFCHMRNNVCELAQFLREGLTGKLFMRASGNRHVEGGFPHKPIDYGRQDPYIKPDQELDTRFNESVGMYQASHESDVFRLNALNVFGVGYILRNTASFCVKYRNRFQLLIDSVISTMLPKFRITDPAGRPLSSEEKYYELEIAQDRTTPKPNEFYVTIPSGDLTVADANYYFYNPAYAGFEKCAVLNPTGSYFTKVNETTYAAIGSHVIGALRGQDIYQLLPDGTYRNLGNSWDESSPFGELLVVIPGLTRNNTYSDASQCKLFRQVTASDTEQLAAQLYVDCKNEDIERLKNYVNLLIRHYRTVLVVTNRKKFKYREILYTTPFTVEDLMVRINSLVECCNFQDDGRPVIHPLPADDYSVREMKLKVNQLVDAICQEAFFLRLIDETDEFYQRYTLDYVIEDFLKEIRLNEDAWKDLIDSGRRADDQQQDETIVHEFDGYCYNDLGFVYNPYKHQFNIDQWKQMDFTLYNQEASYGTSWIKGRVVPHPEGYRDDVTCPYLTYYTSIPGGPLEEKVCDLSSVLDLIIISDVWRACDYIGSMYVLDCTTRLLDSKSPDGDLWLDGLINPRVDVTPEQQNLLNILYDKMLEIRRRLNVIFGMAPVAALTVTDLGVRVSDYSVIYTNE